MSVVVAVILLVGPRVPATRTHKIRSVNSYARRQVVTLAGARQDTLSRWEPIPPNISQDGTLNSPQRRHIRIFLSSPGDVAVEREAARTLIKDALPVDAFLRDKATFELVSWDDPHATTAMPANLTPQEAINRGLPRPRDC